MNSTGLNHLSSASAMYSDDELLPLSGIQHFAFCRRQWALIHVEQQWRENALTTLGDIMHERAHDESFREKRGDVIIVRGLAVHSRRLGLSGKCDVVEFHADDDGVPLDGEEGAWAPIPVEYKRGSRKIGDADRVQLCAQAMCLEEMFACDIPSGYLYYGTTRSRECVECDGPMRERVADMASEMHELFGRGHTPKGKRTKSCKACSLVEICAPNVNRRESVAEYMERRLSEVAQ